MFKIYLDYVFQMLIDLIKENSFTLKKAKNRHYLAETIMNTDYTDDIELLANTPAQAESLLHSLELAAGDIGLYVNTNKTEFMCFDREGTISTLNGSPLKLVDNYMYLSSSSVSLSNICLVQAWTTVDTLLIIGKSDLSDKIK